MKYREIEDNQCNVLKFFTLAIFLPLEQPFSDNFMK